ncbi:hypothetical protein [Streptomyces zhihengii]|uniref:hypothetical protein n=1 Tax=Streptomyces zhihengii TaxID=1818004 RepID=UPI0033B335D0
MIPILLMVSLGPGAAVVAASVVRGLRRRRLARRDEVLAHLGQFPDQTPQQIGWSVGLDADEVIDLLERLRVERLAQCRRDRGALRYRRAPRPSARSGAGDH